MSKIVRPIATVALLAAAHAEPPAYLCQRATTPPVIDGKLDDAVWRDARPTASFIDIEGVHKGAPAHRTRAKLAWDDTHLYIAAELEEPDLYATLTARDSVIFHDPDFEVFLDPEGDGKHYLELEINARNTVWDLWLSRPYRAHGDALHDWNIPGLRTAVTLDGTLNDPRDRDRGWTVEIAIPWASITGVSRNPRTGAPPVPGRIMRLNFSRVDWRLTPQASSPHGYVKQTGADGRPLPELNRVWAPQHAVDMHRPEHWGALIFSDKPAGAPETAPADPDAARRDALYHTMRELTAARTRDGAFPESLPAPLREKLATLFTEVRYAVAGGRRFTLDATSDRTGKRYGMADDGILTASAPDTRAARERDFKAWLWVEAHEKPDDIGFWRERFTAYRRASIDTVLINGDEAQIGRLAPLAAEAGLEVSVWLMALRRHHDAEALRHPEWFAVSRDGKSCHDQPPYVDYYRFLCPTHPGVREHLRQLVARHAAIPGVNAVQLDYIRLPDVILPKGLWQHYGLVQDRELPRYDFCYCAHCRAAFEKAAGRPVADDPTTDAAWRAFRENALRDLVASLAEVAHDARRPLQAAVFPHPELAAQMVRQRWDAWPIDAALPMNYNKFYEQPAAWMQTVTRLAVDAVGGRTPVHPGIYLPDCSADELPELMRFAEAGGASGVAVFSSHSFDAAKQRRFAETLRAIRTRRNAVKQPD